MASRKAQRIPVDFKKLEKIRIENGLELSDMSRELGHERSWYSHVRVVGAMRRTDALLVESKFGVNIILDEKEPVEQEEEINALIDYDKLAEAMSKAIDYDRLASILEKAIDYKMLGEVLTFAMREALK